MSFFHENMLIGSSGQGGAAGYQIQRSLRFNSADSAYLSRTPASAGNRKTWTWAGWVKRSALASGTLFSCTTGTNDSTFHLVYFNADRLDVTGYLSIFRRTNRLFRDVSAWYHIVVAVDTTQATGADRIKVYVNGVQETFSSATDPSQNADLGINQATAHEIGRYGQSPSTALLNGYLADIHFIDGQALTPSSFGEFSATTGVWMPKAYTGSYGTNGFHLEFADNSSNTATTLGKDTSGNGNNWTPNNLSVTAGAGNDSLVDVPTNGSEVDTGSGNEVRGNYAALNLLDKGSNVTLTNGNLDFSVTASNGSIPSTIGMSSGKWYYEMTMTASSGNTPGLVKSGYNTASYVGNDSLSWGYNAANGQKYTGGSGSSYGATFTNGDVIGVAFDADAGTLVFYKNGSSQGTAYTGLTSGPYFFAVGGGSSSGSVNFGQRPFAYTAPSGFKALCTQNLPTPTITNGATAMDVVTYTGTGSTLTPTSTLGFSPDLVWIKSRSAATDHTLYDTVRGTQARLESNTTDAEVTSDNGLTAFNSNGFTLGTLAQVNTNAATYAGWCWDAGSSTVTNNSGTISSQVRANASAGFSVVTYTGTGVNATVGHGLGVAPQLIFVKCRNVARNWNIYSAALGATQYIQFTAAAAGTLNTLWNNTAPTSTVFSLGTSVGVNGSTETHVAYCWAPVEDYSAFGSFTGNGLADGPFVYTGFRPAFVLYKASSATGDWYINDKSRFGYNFDNRDLYANATSTESSGSFIDILSNGFKARSTSVRNTNGVTYVWAAFAEHPFALARAR